MVLIIQEKEYQYNNQRFGINALIYSPGMYAIGLLIAIAHQYMQQMMDKYQVQNRLAKRAQHRVHPTSGIEFYKHFSGFGFFLLQGIIHARPPASNANRSAASSKTLHLLMPNNDYFGKHFDDN